MDKYDYRQAVTEDVRQYIKDNIDLKEWDDLADLADHLNDECSNDDSVTGNASGSYYCNRWEAEEAICHNWDLLEEALTDYGMNLTDIKYGAEGADVICRCYVLPGAIDDVLEEIEDEWERLHDDDQ